MTGWNPSYLLIFFLLYKFFVEWIYYSHYSESTRRAFIFWHQRTLSGLHYLSWPKECLSRFVYEERPAVCPVLCLKSLNPFISVKLSGHNVSILVISSHHVDWVSRMFLKVSKFQNKFLKSSFSPKYKPNIFGDAQYRAEMLKTNEVLSKEWKKSTPQYIPYFLI